MLQIHVSLLFLALAALAYWWFKKR